MPNYSQGSHAEYFGQPGNNVPTGPHIPTYKLYLGGFKPHLEKSEVKHYFNSLSQRHNCQARVISVHKEANKLYGFVTLNNNDVIPSILQTR